jgi:hypothetical protein
VDFGWLVWSYTCFRARGPKISGLSSSRFPPHRLRTSSTPLYKGKSAPVPERATCAFDSQWIRDAVWASFEDEVIRQIKATIDLKGQTME